MYGNFKDIQQPLNLNITIDVTGLKLPEDVKFQVMNAIGNQLDFALMDEEGQSGALFLHNRYMIITHEGELSFTILKDQKALINSISVAILAHLVFYSDR